MVSFFTFCVALRCVGAASSSGGRRGVVFGAQGAAAGAAAQPSTPMLFPPPPPPLHPRTCPLSLQTPRLVPPPPLPPFLQCSMAEICSAYPTSGALYFWSAKLAGPRWAPVASWVTGWFNLLGQVRVVCPAPCFLPVFLVCVWSSSCRARAHLRAPRRPPCTPPTHPPRTPTPRQVAVTAGIDFTLASFLSTIILLGTGGAQGARRDVRARVWGAACCCMGGSAHAREQAPTP